MQPNLREQMLMHGQVDGVFGYVNTIRFSAKLIGVEDKQLRFINYGDYGMDLYSNAIIVSKKLVKEKPEGGDGPGARDQQGADRLAQGPRRRGRRGRQARAADQGAGRARALRCQTLKDEMNHPEIAKIGLGNVDMARLKKSIDILVDANKLPRTPTVEEIFTPAFLPPARRPAEEASMFWSEAAQAAARVLPLQRESSAERAAPSGVPEGRRRTAGNHHGPAAQRDASR